MGTLSRQRDEHGTVTILHFILRERCRMLSIFSIPITTLNILLDDGLFI
jgi:hypothetical protein